MNIFQKYLIIGIVALFFIVSIAPTIISKESEIFKNVKLTINGSNCNWIVDDEGDLGSFETIQEAISVASDNQVICVYSGNYSGEIVVNGLTGLQIIGIPFEYHSAPGRRTDPCSRPLETPRPGFG